jgi:hypothetical protein
MKKLSKLLMYVSTFNGGCRGEIKEEISSQFILTPTQYDIKENKEDCELSIFDVQFNFSNKKTALYFVEVLSHLSFVKDKNNEEFINFLRLLQAVRLFCDAISKELYLKEDPGYIQFSQVEHNIEKIRQIRKKISIFDSCQRPVNDMDLYLLTLDFTYMNNCRKYDAFYSVFRGKGIMKSKIKLPFEEFKKYTFEGFCIIRTLILISGLEKMNDNKQLTEMDEIKDSFILKNIEMELVYIENPFTLKKDEYRILRRNGVYDLIIFDILFTFPSQNQLDFFLTTLTCLSFKKKEDFIELLQTILALESFMKNLNKNCNTQENIIFLPPQDGDKVINEIEEQKNKLPLLKHLEIIELLDFYQDWIDENKRNQYDIKIFYEENNESAYGNLMKAKIKVPVKEYRENMLRLLYVFYALFFLRIHYDKYQNLKKVRGIKNEYFRKSLELSVIL